MLWPCRFCYGDSFISSTILTSAIFATGGWYYHPVPVTFFDLESLCQSVADGVTSVPRYSTSSVRMTTPSLWTGMRKALALMANYVSTCNE